MNQAAKRAAKSNRKPRTRQNAQRELTRMLAAADAGTLPERTVAIEQSDGTFFNLSGRAVRQAQEDWSLHPSRVCRGARAETVSASEESDSAKR